MKPSVSPLCRVLAAFVAGAAFAIAAMSQSPATPKPSEPSAAETAATAATPAADPLLWLEEVQGERALAWVRERNAESEKRLMALPGFETLRTQLREVLDSREQIPYVSRIGEQFYNLWRDAANPRGLWRRTTLAEYRKPQPAWETVLDLDALGRAEKESWVWAGARCLAPEYRRCLLSLSRGGADATVVREFDLVDKRFVAERAFMLPEAKTQVDWLSADEILVGTDFGPGSMTDSGYARVFKRWKRGTPLASAAAVFEGERKDVAAVAGFDDTPGFERLVVGRAIDFYNSTMALVQGDKIVPVDKPLDASLSLVRDWVLIELRSDWAVDGQRFAKGSLLIGNATAYLRGERRLTPLFTPTATRSLAGFTVSRDAVFVNVLDNVSSRIEEWRSGAGSAWTRRELKAPYPGSLSIGALHDPHRKDDPLADAFFLNASDFLTPDSLQLGRAGSDTLETLKSRPTFWPKEGMRVEQRFATSKDGTRVPYFVIWPAGARADGNNPTLLYGYGGFEVSQTPFYSGMVGRAWTTRGGVYVMANIRGGGEFGPAWHQAALTRNRQRSFDDFAAIAEDLIKTGVTRRERLGIMGGSNGGLLVGAVMLQRPELFGAVVCQVPLLDMRRFHLLLAGASWMAEYGNPDDPADWAALAAYSPYQNVRPGRKLPPVLFTTSTRDDRVHPGHARKMAERMRGMGYDVSYWENIEGGHGGAADNAQRAQMAALEYAYLWEKLNGGLGSAGPFGRAAAADGVKTAVALTCPSAPVACSDGSTAGSGH